MFSLLAVLVRFKIKLMQRQKRQAAANLDQNLKL